MVVIEDLDRLSRHLPDLMAIFYELKLLDIELHDLQNGQLELIHIVMRGYMAEEGRVRFLALSKAGKRKAVADGLHMAKVAYGHIRVEGETGVHAKHPVTAAIVKDIFRWIGEGVAASAVARILTERDVLPPAQQLQADNGAQPARVRPWHGTTVLKIVRNHLYMGLVSWGKSAAVYDYGRRKRVTYEGTDPADWIVVEAKDLALVGAEEWMRANLRVADDGHAGHMHLGRFLLTGKAVCCACGAPMTSATGAASKPAYVCSVANLGQTARCTSLARFRVEHLERAVVAKVNEEVLVPEALERLGRRFVAEVDALVGGDDRRRREIEARLSKIDAMMKASFEEAEDKGVTGARLVKLRIDWEEESVRLEAELERLRRIEDCMAPSPPWRHCAKASTRCSTRCRSGPGTRAASRTPRRCATSSARCVPSLPTGRAASGWRSQSIRYAACAASSPDSPRGRRGARRRNPANAGRRGAARRGLRDPRRRLPS